MVQWDAPAVVLVIGALVAGIVTVMKTWQTGTKVDEMAAATTEKLSAIHDSTNGGLSEVKAQNAALSEELRRVLAAHQVTTDTALAAAMAKNVALEAEVVKRADASMPPIPQRQPNERKDDPKREP